MDASEEKDTISTSRAGSRQISARKMNRQLISTFVNGLTRVYFNTLFFAFLAIV